MVSVRRKTTLVYAAACVGALVAGQALGQRGAMPLPPKDAAGPAREAAVSAEIPVEAEELITNLSSPEFAVRQRATEQLLSDERLTLPMLEKALARPETTIEARQRLMQVGRQIFLRTPRAAMGVSFDRMFSNRVVVTATYDKFASKRLLEEGDLIVEARGTRLIGPGAQMLLQAIIISHDPGEEIPIVVRRGEQKLALSIPLGRFADLQDVQNNNVPVAAYLPEDRLARGWRIRAGRMAPTPQAQVIRLSVPAAVWSTAAEQSLKRDLALQRRQAVEAVPQVAGGGMPRGAEMLVDEQRFVQQVMVIGGQRQIINMPAMQQQFGDLEIDAMTPAMPAAEELKRLSEAKARYTAELKLLTEPVDLSPNSLMRETIANKQRSLELVDKQRRAIEAEVAEQNGGKQSTAEVPDAK